MKKIIVILLSSIFILGFMRLSPALFQEGNPVPILKGIVKLSSSDEKIVQISESPQQYLTKTNAGSTPLVKLMNKEGWKFDEHLGSGYFFSKDGDKLIITSVQYTGKYRVWTFND